MDIVLELKHIKSNVTRIHAVLHGYTFSKEFVVIVVKQSLVKCAMACDFLKFVKIKMQA